jgi:hypothetical protein
VKANAASRLRPILLTGMLAATVFLFRFPDCFHHFRNWDEAALMSEAWAMTQGQVLYRDLYTVHPLFHFFLFIPFFEALPNDWVPHAVKGMNLLLVFVGALLIRILAEKIYRDSWCGWGAAFAYAFFLGNFHWTLSSHGEFYTLVPVLGAALCLVSSAPKSRAAPLAAGFLCAAAFFLKQVALFDTAALFLVFGLSWNRRQIGRRFAFFMTGAAAAAFLAFLYPLYHGTVGESIESMFFHNVRSYASGLAADSPFERLFSGAWIFCRLLGDFFRAALEAPAVSCVLAAAILGSAWNRLENGREKPPRVRRLWPWAFAWPAIDLFGIALIGRFYPHYFTQLAPGAALFFVYWLRRSPPLLKRFLVLLFAAWSFQVAWTEFRNEYAKNGFFPARVKRSREIARFVRHNTRPDQTLFLYRELALDVYYLAERLSPNGIYMFVDMDVMHTHDARGQRIHRERLRERPPDVMIVGALSDPMGSTAGRFFTKLLEERYGPGRKLEKCRIHFLEGARESARLPSTRESDGAKREARHSSSSTAGTPPA